MESKNPKGVVLENGNVLFNGEEYKQIDRQAKIGEYIRIISPWMTGGSYNKEDILKVIKSEDESVACKEVEICIISNREYLVLEPVKKTSVLERIDELINELYDLKTLVEGQAQAEIEKPEIAERELIVEKAKNDIEKLACKDDCVQDEFENPVYDYGIRVTKAEFVVNKEKRTVVCLLKGARTPVLYSKGIAKCAPHECFNVHIGKAIALRSALGLEIPDEYLNAPQPEKAEVGDIINFGIGPAKLTERHQICDNFGFGKAFNHDRNDGWIGENQFKIIDDSRE